MSLPPASRASASRTIPPEVAWKIARLRDGEAPRVLDLFAGCGGLSLGFLRAGCRILAGVELDPDAARVHATNFHRLADGSPDPRHAQAHDITTLDPLGFVAALEPGPAPHAVDVLVGGPPCPAFTRVGRAKLREVARHPEAYRHDPRARLYLPYLRFVEALAPLAVVMENVPDLLNWGGHNLGEEICETLESLGYVCTYTLINAASHGVPQFRERFFLVALRRELGVRFVPPTASHAARIPAGTLAARRVALKHVATGDLFDVCRYVPAPPGTVDAPAAVSVAEALDDLPVLVDHLGRNAGRGRRRSLVEMPYPADRVPSAYARALREWPGFESLTVKDHVIRGLGPRDQAIFRDMRPGDEYPQAHAIAERLFASALRDTGSITKNSAAWRGLRARHVPPYDPGKFPNKWRKLSPDEPARTLMAHLGKDGYSHIHHDGAQARTISVREAARLQSFPDGFTFTPTLNAAFRQIGNAVPPLLAWRALAMPLVQILHGHTARTPTVGWAPAQSEAGELTARG